MFKVLLAALVLACSLSAGTITNIVVIGVTPGQPINLWDTETGPTWADVWTQSPVGPYASNLLNIIPGSSGTLNLWLEGFGGIGGPSIVHSEYMLVVNHDGDTITLNCSVLGGVCTAGPSPATLNGLTISAFNMQNTAMDAVTVFAGRADNTGADIAASFSYSLEGGSAIPEPASLALAAAGLAAVGLLRRRR